MAGKIYIGIGGWTFEPWRGPFYPEGLTHKRELEYASRKLTSIEINGTYYSSFKPAIEKGLADNVPVYDVLKTLGAKRWTKESGMCKVFCSDAAMKVTADCVQMCGGIGYMRDFPVEKYMRDAKITQIYEGTNQIQRNEIAMMMIKEAASRQKTEAVPA